MSIPTGDITNHSLLWYNPNNGRVVCSNAGTTGRFGGAVLDKASLSTAVSTLRRPSTYNPPVFGEGLDTANVPGDSVVVGTQNASTVSRPIPSAVTAIGFGCLSGKISNGATIMGLRASNSGRCGGSSVCVGNAAGDTSGDLCVAIGWDTLRVNSAASGPDGTVAIGWGAGHKDAGNSCLYLGRSAGIDGGNFDNAICLGEVNPTQSNSFFVKPVRLYVPSGTGAVPLPLHYIEATSEIVCVPLTEPKLAIKESSGTTITLPTVANDFVRYPDPCRVEFELKRATRVQFVYGVDIGIKYAGDITNKSVGVAHALELDGAIQPGRWTILAGDLLSIGNIGIPSMVHSKMMAPGKHVVELKFTTREVYDPAVVSVWVHYSTVEVSWDD